MRTSISRRIVLFSMILGCSLPACSQINEVVLVFWTEKKRFLDRAAALKMEESQCPKPARVTHRA